MREEKLLGLRADLQVGGRGFRRFSTIFLEFFYNFLENFWKISTIFWKIFAIFLENFYNLLRFFGKFFRKFSLTIRYGSTGVSPYCKFTRKFTSKFTPILIKILQSTKFEGNTFSIPQPLLQLLIDFHNSLPTFSTPYPLSQVFALFALFALRHRVFSTIAPPFQRPKRPSLPLRRRRYVGNTRDYKQDYKSYCKSAYELATGAKAHEKPRKTEAPSTTSSHVPPSTSSPPHSEKLPNTYKLDYKYTCKPTHTTPLHVFSEKNSKYL